MKLVDSKDIKNIQIQILESIDSYCVEHNIKYILYAGTLLGAVRHKGFIPWDDDIDLAMPRPDYERFMREYCDENFNAKCYENDNSFLFTFGKVDDKRTLLVENKSNPIKMGVFVDIFPIDGLPDNKFFAMIHANIAHALFYVINMKQMKFSKKRTIKKNIVLALSKIVLSPLSYETLVKITIKHAKKYPFDTSNSVANLSWGFGKKEIANHNVFFDRERVPFEEVFAYIPKDYDQILTRKYGDYMAPPPKSEQKSHHGFVVYYK